MSGDESETGPGAGSEPAGASGATGASGGTGGAEASGGAASAGGGPGEGSPGGAGAGGGAAVAQERRPELDELTANGGGAEPASLSMLYDLSVPVAIELGRTRMSVEEILRLGRGSVIQLDRLAGEPIDVFVGDRRFAQGEVVVVGEQFGIRLTRILEPPKKKEEGA